MKRIIKYIVKEDLGNSIIAEDQIELHEFDNCEASKYYYFKKLSDKVEDKIKNLQR